MATRLPCHEVVLVPPTFGGRATRRARACQPAPPAVKKSSGLGAGTFACRLAAAVNRSREDPLRRVATAFFVATVGTAVFGGTAQAATLTATPAKACYVSGEQVDVNGTGFTPSSTVNATFAGNSGTFVTDTAGAVEPLRLTFPSVKGIKLLAMTVTDVTNPAITASLNFRTTLLHVDVNPTNAKAGKKLRIK